jgi:hypothetical protein
MIVFHLPAVLRSLHEATGVGIWLSCFLLAYLSGRVLPTRHTGAVVIPPVRHAVAGMMARGADL